MIEFFCVCGPAPPPHVQQSKSNFRNIQKINQLLCIFAKKIYIFPTNEKTKFLQNQISGQLSCDTWPKN